jgi:carnitine-CoA ligase
MERKSAIRAIAHCRFCFEVEQVLLSHPAIANAAVFPVRSSLAEDEVMAALLLHPGQELSPADLIAYCTPRLPYFAVPRYLEFMNELPTTENGKVQKYKLHERGVTHATWDGGSGGQRGSTAAECMRRGALGEIRTPDPQIRRSRENSFPSPSFGATGM